jgi:DNA-3-methyladenine glycosylase II
LLELPDEEIVAQLIQVKGIGRWTAEMFLIFYLGRLDVLPLTDLGVRKAMQKIYSGAAKTSRNVIYLSTMEAL